ERSGRARDRVGPGVRAGVAELGLAARVREPEAVGGVGAGRFELNADLLQRLAAVRDGRGDALRRIHLAGARLRTERHACDAADGEPARVAVRVGVGEAVALDAEARRARERVRARGDRNLRAREAGVPDGCEGARYWLVVQEDSAVDRVVRRNHVEV